MKVHELEIRSKKNAKRVGRGIGSGKGKTAGRGTKGQLSRSGGNLPPHFEGGQNPLVHRIPKQRGFKSLRPRMQIIHTDQLNRFKANQTVGQSELANAGLIRTVKVPTKLLKRGELSKPLILNIKIASAAAQKVLESAGGRMEKTPLKASRKKSAGQSA